MLQGTGSDVGKSVLTAGLCRAFSRRGLVTRPFKPQNMSNNAAVTCDGGEIGRAQALQARACGTDPHTDMNPVLIKPQSETGAQIVVQGQVIGSAAASEFQLMKPDLMAVILECYRRLADKADLILIEGAGSAAEVNLRQGDIANMGFAEAASAPVVLIGDIDRGGVIAQLVGTWALLSASERSLVRGFVVNKFRGDLSLFEGGVREIRHRTGMASFGVVPWLDAASRLPREDAFSLPQDSPGEPESVKIAVPVMPRIANFDDLDPLRAEPGVTVQMVRAGKALPGDADLILLPGSKATRSDLAWLYRQGWDIDIKAHLRRGGFVLGICGGYQMLGRLVADPEGIEGPSGTTTGLGLLDITTHLQPSKTLRRVSGTDTLGGHNVEGYEMHMGMTSGRDTSSPLLYLGEKADGAVSPDGRVMGCYLHGLLASDGFRKSLLERLSPRGREFLDFEAVVESTLDRLADHLVSHLDLDAMLHASAIVSKSSAPSRPAAAR